jgi:hypothetical protein
MTTEVRVLDLHIRARARRILAVTLASFALASVYAQAPSPKDPLPAAEAAFQRADTNKDNKLSKEEAARLPAIAAKFEELDKNKDGFLSLDEFMTGYTAREP